MKNNLKAIQNNNNSSHNKAIFAVLVVVAVLLAAAIGLSFSDLLFPVSTAPTDSEYAGASLFTPTTSSLLSASNGTNCTDTDGGIKPYTKGTVRYNGKTYTDFCWEKGKNVTMSNVTAEFYCWNNVANRTLIYCPDGCSDGKCLITVTNATLPDTTPGAKFDEFWFSQNGKCCAGQFHYHCCARD